MTPNLKALRIFAFAARHGSFQSAAEELNITHGAVSQRIKRLESDLGVRLFERHARGVVLTPQGASYVPSVEQALSIIATATTDLRRASDALTFHLGPSFASKWLMPRLETLAVRFPDISVATEIHDVPVERALGRNEIAIWPARRGAPAPGCNVRCLSQIRLIAVCSPDLSRPTGPVDMESLLRLPLLQDAHRRWEKLIRDTGFETAHPVLNFDRSALALEAAIQGHGVAIAPTYLIENDLRAGRLVDIWHSPDAPDAHLYMSWADTDSRDRALRDMVTWVLAEFGHPEPARMTA